MDVGSIKLDYILVMVGLSLGSSSWVDYVYYWHWVVMDHIFLRQPSPFDALFSVCMALRCLLSAIY